MKIGIVTTWFERGAAYVSRQFMDILKSTDEVFIYARGGEAYAQGNPVWDLPNVHWGTRKPKTMYLYPGGTYIDKKDFESWIKKNSVELILFNEQQWFTPVVWAKQMGVKVVSYVDYYTEETIPLFDIFDGVICNTQRHAFAFRNHKSVQYIKWGTNTQLYKPSDVKNDKIVFFHSAGMAPIRKGTDLLIEAFYQAANRKDAKLLLHTQVSLEKQLPDLNYMIKELQEEDSMEVVEGTISAPGLYHKADVYVYPSRLDGIGLTLMEAISAGLVCITSDNAPMNEFIEKDFGLVTPIDYYYSRKDGYYWPMCVCNVSYLSTQISDIIANKYELDTMKRKAREYAESELDFEKNFKQLHSLLSSVKFDDDYEKTAQAILHKDKVGMRKYLFVIETLVTIKKMFR